MSRRLTLLALLLLAPPALPSLAALAQSAPAGLNVTAPAPRDGVPGGYVTLTFVAEGQGEYVFAVDSPPEWVPVTRTRTVSLNGSTLIPVTFQVPALAQAGDSPPLVLRALRNGTEVARSQTRVQVQPRARIALRSPQQLTGVPGQTLSFPLDVTNLGNQTDTVRLETTNVDRRPQLSASEVTLQPGETRTVTVSLKLDNVSENYRYVTFFSAVSSRDPAVSVRTRTESVFTSLAERGASANRGPRLTFSVHSAVEAGVDWSSAGRSTYLRYALQPTVSGQLSDYVTGSAAVAGLEGSLDHPLPSNVSFGVRLDSKRWSVSLDGGRDGFGVSGTLLVGGWQLSPRAQYRLLLDGRMYGAGLGASTTLAGGTLNVDAATMVLSQGANSQRTDTLGVRYSRRLTPNLDLSLGLSGAGFSVGGRYQGTLFVTEQLTYVAPFFDVTQTYTGSLAGLHTFNVSGGLSNIRPFGVRAAATVQVQPGGLTWSTSGLVLYSGPNGLGATLAAQVRGGTLPEARAAWQVTAGVTPPAFRVRGATLSTSAAYTVGSDDDTPGALASSAEGGATLVAGRLRADAVARWSRDPAPTGTTQERLYFGLTGLYDWKNNTFAALYSYERRSGQALGAGGLGAGSVGVTHTLGLTWERTWTDRLSSRLDYSHAVLLTGEQRRSPDQLALTFSVQDVLLPGLKVSAGYRVFAPNGLLAGSLTQGVRVGVSYDFSRVVATPDFLVDTFGGRKGGEVRGLLYRDSNLNGRRDEGEPGLPGVTVRVGTASGVSDAQGRYSVRAPVGGYSLAFPAGLPATLEALEAPAVQVTENGRTDLNVAFSPVVNLEVLVFQDTNRNGTPDPGEAPIPYAGVALSGPVVRAVQADGRGYVRLGTLPPGSYMLALNPANLPEDYTPTGEAQRIELRAGERPPAVSLGAALPPRQAVTTYTGGALAVLGRLSPSTSAPGDPVQLTVQAQGARSLSVEVLGQTFTPALDGNRATLEFTVPAGTAPGTYDVNVSATGDGGNKTFTLKLLVIAPNGGR
ncbi:hypothetical protein DEIPH_ctg011orf0194 [Deinococcus phoenicis]|uniref:SD-repeat containing protein B domain-containing protein n=1 Tax=Deinococcus phoenicis TaxID=1476583 RepID=A0A016QTJ4_9DEIO|nr:hypothetical protein [Deinococcus phoenicis]EYB69202.1 hypothetical protein DEIPH_ctg011orf0194 [Deinococcus phoenicis]